jgi:deoxyribonuclease V
MILAVDVDYRDDKAIVAGVSFNQWSDDKPAKEWVIQVSSPAAYVPGQFYRRELPCILALLKQIDEVPAYILIDGYVYLGRDKKPGLGQYLFEALPDDTVVIGVAKKRFKNTPEGTEIYRGKSKRPLYVTAAGIDEAEARQLILGMYGHYRIPVLLKRADQLCRQTSAP